MTDAVLYGAIFSASVVSGMLGIGVAFAAIPILAVGNMDLINEIQPIALFLNGVTALFSAVSFARAGYVEWPPAFALALVASVFSPLGALAAAHTAETVLWFTYFLAVVVVVCLLWRDRPAAGKALPFNLILWLSAPISAISGLLGVGPGFLIVPIMIFAGFGPRRAAALNAVAVTPASFVSLVPHLEHASVDVATALPIVVSAAGGALLGGYLSSTRVSEVALRRLFIVVIVALSIHRGVAMFGVHAPNSVDYRPCPKKQATTASARVGPCPQP